VRRTRQRRAKQHAEKTVALVFVRVQQQKPSSSSSDNNKIKKKKKKKKKQGRHSLKILV